MIMDERLKELDETRRKARHFGGAFRFLFLLSRCSCRACRSRRARAASPVPVYAIGGITPERLPAVLAVGARGVCVMGALMRCPDPDALLRQFCPQKKSPQKTQNIQKK